VVAVGERARLALSKLIKNTRVSVRNVVTQTRHVLRGVVRRSNRDGRTLGDLVENPGDRTA
jgi:hypothetical protein